MASNKRRRRTPDQIIRKLAEGNKLLWTGTKRVPLTLSAAACESIADFARRIARMALNNVIRATVDNETVDAHTRARRDEYHHRSENLKLSGDLEYLFAIPTSPPLAPAAGP